MLKHYVRLSSTRCSDFTATVIFVNVVGSRYQTTDITKLIQNMINRLLAARLAAAAERLVFFAQYLFYLLV